MGWGESSKAPLGDQVNIEVSTRQRFWDFADEDKNSVRRSAANLSMRLQDNISTSFG